jgi:hypothetical protein
VQRAGNQLVDVDSLIPAVLRNLITAAARDNQYLWCVHHNGLGWLGWMCSVLERAQLTVYCCVCELGSGAARWALPSTVPA